MALENVFGANLRKARLFQNLSIYDLAEKSNTTPACISQIENGKRRPNLETAKRLGLALGTGIDYLIFGREKLCEKCKMTKNELGKILAKI